MIQYSQSGDIIVSVKANDIIERIVDTEVDAGLITLVGVEGMSDEEIREHFRAQLFMDQDILRERITESISDMLTGVMEQYPNHGVWRVLFERGFVIGERVVHASDGYALIDGISDGIDSFKDKWLSDISFICDVFQCVNKNGFILEMVNSEHMTKVSVSVD